MAKDTLRIISPNGHLGFAPTKEGSFWLGAATKPDYYCCDSGSDDIGPVPLGADKCASHKDWQYHDLELMLLASREQGVPMEDAIAAFREWCGKDVTFLTWGFDDITILRENLRLYGLDENWVSRWYNAQMIFNAQTDGSTAQKALKTAMEMFEIVASRPAHDALGDAYHTALICARLDLERGICEYEDALKSHVNGFHGAELPGCISRKVFYDYPDKRAALAAMAGAENKCPTCGRQMLGSRWFAQPGRRYMDLATCPDHGQFLIRVRLSQQPEGTVRVSRLTYEAGSEAAQAYAKRAEKAEPEAPRSSARRRRSRIAEKKE